MSGKDESIFSKSALMGTKPGKQIIKQGLFKSKGFKQFNQYKEEAENTFPEFAKRFAKNLFDQINSDESPNTTQQKFAEEVGSTEIILNASEIDPIKAKLGDFDTLHDRVLRILNSNFVKMTFPVFNGLFDASTDYFKDDPSTNMREDIVDGHIIAIDLSEPMDRIVDKDEDLEYLDDYKLMNPYILKLAREKISKGGEDVLKEFEEIQQRGNLSTNNLDTILQDLEKKGLMQPVEKTGPFGKSIQLRITEKGAAEFRRM